MEGLQLGKLAIEVSAEGVDKAKQQVDSLQSSVEKTGEGSKGVTGLGNSFKDLTGKLKDTISQQKICGTTVGSLVDKFKSATGVTDLTSMAVGGLTTACIALAVEGISKLGEALDEIAGAGDRIDKMSQKMNISAEAFQQWDSIAQHNGSSIESYAGIMKKLGMTLEQNTDLYNQLGVATTNIDGSLRSNNEIFQDTIIKLGEMEDVNQRNAIATELFGRQAAELYPLLNSGADGIREQVEASKEAIIYTDEYVKSSANLCDASQRLGEQMNGMKVSLLGGMVQPLADMKNTLAEVIVKLQPLLSLLGTLGGGLLKGVADAFKVVGEAVKLLLDGVNLVVKPIKEMADILRDCCQPIKNAWNTLYGGIADGAKDSADAAKDAFADAAKDITNETYDANEAYNKLVTDRINDEVKQYREKLEKQKGSSLKSQMEIERSVAEYTKKREKHYDDLKRYYVKNEEDMTKATEKELEKQTKTTESMVNKIKKLFKSLVDAFSFGSFSKAMDSVSSGIKHNATGSSYYIGGLTMVGETGRELVQLPRGSKIYNNRETENILNGGATGNTTQYFNITIDPKNVKEFNDIIDICNNARMILV